MPPSIHRHHRLPVGFPCAVHFRSGATPNRYPRAGQLNVKRDIPYAEPADPRQNVDIYVPEKDPGIPARRCAAKETNHSKLNENVGLPDDPPTKALFEFVDEALRK